MDFYWALGVYTAWSVLAADLGEANKMLGVEGKQRDDVSILYLRSLLRYAIG